MENKIPLSVAIIVKNEEENLPGCLHSVSFADQIVVVDSGSSDRTVQIAIEFGCDTYVEPWRGFGPQKQSAIDLCRNQWILVLDADERIPEETAYTIKEVILQTGKSYKSFSFKRKNYFQGRWIRHMGWWPDRVVRLFRKESGRMSSSIVHEAVLIDGSVRDLDASIDHYTESRMSHVLQKIDHYSSLGAEQAYREGKKASAWSAGLRAGLTFLQNYFLRLGFLDGAQGFTLSITDSINKFFKYAKLNELHRDLKRNRPAEPKESSLNSKITDQ